MERQELASISNEGHLKLGVTRSTQESPLKGSIDLLPEELLVCIFKPLVEYDPPFVGRLLFVCRYWHRIVQSTPSLWSKILVKLQNPIDIVKYTHYVSSATTKSNDLLLDMTIDIFQLHKYFDHPQNTLGPHKFELATLFHHVFGHEGANVVRWKSFRLHLHNHPAPDRTGVEAMVGVFMATLDRPVPHLEALSLHLNSANEFFPGTGGPLQDRRSLKHLMMDAGGSLGHLKCVPEKIETLSFRLWGSTKVMAPFTNLRELLISSVPNAGITHKRDPIIEFPLLECFTLDVWYPRHGVGPATQLVQKIRAPLLNTLRLLDDQGLLSVANATAFHQVRTLDLLSPSSGPDGILEFIASHLHKYTELTSLTVCPWHLESVAQCLSSLLKSRGRVPIGLEVIYTVVSNKQGVILDSKEAAKMFLIWSSASDFIYRTHPLSSRVVGANESVAKS